jgi:putative FmdB family regulatory protein
MPTYEYKCSDCKYEFEEVQSINDDPITVCPKCKGKVSILISKTFAKVEYSDQREYYERVIKPDAHRIAERIKGGDEDAAADFFGEPE